MSNTEYQHVLNLASQDRHDEAIVFMRRYLTQHPDDAEAWNDAGVILYRLGRYREAAVCLERSLDGVKDPFHAFLNLLETCLAAGEFVTLGLLTETMIQKKSMSIDFHQEVCRDLKKRGYSAAAMEVLLAGRRNGIEDSLRMYEELLSEQPKIALFCGGDGATFLQEIQHWLADRYPVQMFEGNTVEQVHRLMEWSDISWFEWATELAEIGSRISGVCRKIVRLHRYEAYLDWPCRIRWENIDALVTVGNPCVHEALLAQVPDLPHRTKWVTIPNGLNLAKIPFRERQSGKNLAFVGNMRMVKNPMLLLQCFTKLIQINPDYHLFWAGKVQDTVVEQYVRHMVDSLELKENVHYQGWQTDISSWLSDKHYIVCTSVIESQGMGVLEAMAMGLKPVVHNFPGAERTFGQEWLFDTPEQFCAQILVPQYESIRYRQFVEQRYSLQQQLGHIGKVLADLKTPVYRSVDSFRAEAVLS
ncbi:MAG: glycosyltransferase [Sedimentisphaerales bacterium]|nr:glycosyltransferase [Sedimentisphaerales bacterium]